MSHCATTTSTIRTARRQFSLASSSGRNVCHKVAFALVVAAVLNHWIIPGNTGKATVSALGLIQRRRSTPITITLLTLAATKKKATGSSSSSRSSGGGGSSSIKGFGGVTVSSTKSSSRRTTLELDRSPESVLFHEAFLEQPISTATNNNDNKLTTTPSTGARDTIKRTALAYYDTPSSPALSSQDSELSKIRGVVASKDIPKGSDIINIPYELAINLGPEGADPTLPAVMFLRDYCTVLQPLPPDSAPTTTNVQQAGPLQHYYRILPPYQGEDCLGSTDFFSDAALDALQSPLIVEETLARRAQTELRFQLDVASASLDPFPLWIDGVTTVTAHHLQWAVWLITSRVLTVQGSSGDPDSPSSSAQRLLIPYLDMCNHDRSSPHVLTGRAMPGGQLRVVAGAPVAAGEPIVIAYGGGDAGNNRFVQDYGFLDTTAPAFNSLIGKSGVDGYGVVAQELLGQRRILEVGSRAGRTMTVSDRERSLEALKATTIDADLDLLRVEKDPSIRIAIQYRLGVKQALVSEE